MTWEETINYIRSKEEYAALVDQAYLHSNLKLNVENFLLSDEFNHTLKLIEQTKPGALRILDVGCGNGIASISFALKGHEVVAIDPDPSPTIGTGAVDRLRQMLGLNNVMTITSTAEDLNYDPQSFDLIYSRQAMHHAHDLNKFIANCTRFLKKRGLFVTVRDHVIYDSRDKQKFFDEHPLHKFYHGENAYLSSEYRNAFNLAGLEILNEIKFFDSVINYFPLTMSDIENRIRQEELLIRKNLEKRLGVLGNTNLINFLYKHLFFNPDKLRDERFYSGRMYSYVSIKK
ncbi:MAG: class I SAM-dependent methyltransferase [Bacteroidetes bacterium]|nr:class I SAM-dependent methyltransferase [Bacteroidota bacterium]